MFSVIGLKYYIFLAAMNDTALEIENLVMFNTTRSDNLTRDYNDTCKLRVNVTETCLDVEVEQGDYLYKVGRKILIVMKSCMMYLSIYMGCHYQKLSLLYERPYQN